MKKCQLGDHKYGLVFFCALTVWLLLDIVSKHLVSVHMVPGETIDLNVGFVQLTFVRNFGCAFGMLQDSQLVFMLAASITIGVIYWYFPLICQVAGRWGSLTAGCVIAGALGNLIDRVRLGYVVDFIDLKWWPVFNVADIGVSVGFPLLAFWLIYNHSETEEEDDREDESEVGTSSIASSDDE